MAIFTGAGVAIVTPMKENGEVNYDKMGELLDYQINNSTDAIVVCGTTGEASTLTHEEHIETIRFTADYVKKRVPVIAGTGSNCTETAIYLSQEAQKTVVSVQTEDSLKKALWMNTDWIRFVNSMIWLHSVVKSLQTWLLAGCFSTKKLPAF